ncbi:hypothetical protein NMY22_g10523 [Coprinellus aureogranulatus]|nr:hypothetical protein NMY22_g10523 [Coprinellus aureogranulatus]
MGQLTRLFPLPTVRLVSLRWWRTAHRLQIELDLSLLPLGIEAYFLQLQRSSQFTMAEDDGMGLLLAQNSVCGPTKDTADRDLGLPPGSEFNPSTTERSQANEDTLTAQQNGASVCDSSGVGDTPGQQVYNCSTETRPATPPPPKGADGRVTLVSFDKQNAGVHQTYSHSSRNHRIARHRRRMGMSLYYERRPDAQLALLSELLE